MKFARLRASNRRRRPVRWCIVSYDNAIDTKNAGMIGLGVMGTALTEMHRRLLEAAEAASFGDADHSAIIRAFQPHGDLS